MREHEFLSERISISPDYNKLFNYIMNALKQTNYRVDGLTFEQYQATIVHMIDTIFNILEQFIQQKHNLQTVVKYDYGNLLDDTTYGQYYPDSDSIVLNISSLLYYAELYFNKESHHQSFFSGFAKYLKLLLRSYFHELTHAIQTRRIADKHLPNFDKFVTGVMNLDKSKLKRTPNSPTEAYHTKHAEIEAFAKTFLHNIILKDYKKFKNLSGPELSNKIREIIIKNIPLQYRKYKGTESDHIYRTIVKKLYLDIMDYIEDMRKE